MKKLFRNLLETILKFLAKAVLLKYKPELVGVTGSIGKTSTKDAITCVLSAKFKVRSNQKNYNNELGLPLTVIGADSGGRSMLSWMKAIAKAINLLILKNSDYPKIVILEMGVDKPGDMDYLLSIVKLKVALLTFIGSSHLENFGSQKKLAEEKSKIFNGLVKNGTAILNFDNLLTRERLLSINRQAMTYGLSLGADVQGTNVAWSFYEAEHRRQLGGVNFKIKHQESIIPMLLSNVVGEPALYAALAAVAVGLAFGMNGLEITEALQHWQTPPGRMKLIEGINNSIIIDDTYNAAPQSTLAALNVLDGIRQMGAARKWAVLGDMKELGQESETGHKAVGERVAAIPKGRLVFMGPMAHYYAVGARQQKMSEERIHEFNNHQEIIDYLIEHLEANDLVLVKGSQSMRMEKIVLGLMQKPEKAKDLLVRQGQDWA